MFRKDITKLLGELLIRDVLNKKYWANEVTFNYGRKNEHRIDFMTFAPVNQSTSGIERGSFSAYEVKSCLADYRSKNGHNLTMDKNYYVMPMELYLKVAGELHHKTGVYCPIPAGREVYDEFEHPTKINELISERLYLRCIRNATTTERNVGNLTALFCMMRSGQNR